MDKFIFVRLCHNYADEFDVNCCYVTTAKEHFNELERIHSLFKSGQISGRNEFYFGSNEALQFDSFAKLLEGITTTECTKEYYDEFNKLNSNGCVGFCVLDNMYV